MPGIYTSADRRDWDPPGSYKDQQWNVENAREMGNEAGMGMSATARTTGHQRLWQSLATGQP